MRRRASATPTACRRARLGGRSRRACRRMRSSRPTSATTARSATPIRRSSRAANIWRPGLFGPCGYGFPSIIGAKIGCPDVPVVGFAGDGAFGISMNEMSSIGRKEWPAITMVIFRNYQWGAEKRNTIALVRQQLRRHRARPASQLREDRRGLRAEGRDSADAAGS